MATGSSKATSPNTELDEDDLKLLYNTLYRIRKKYALLGMQIGLKKSEIDDIVAQKLDPSMSLLEVLSVRVKKAKALTWNDIYNALRSECIDESKLAKEIWAKHLFIPESSTESESEQEHEIKSEEIKRVKNRAPKKQKGGDHRARVSKERERSSEYEGIETVRSKKYVQEVESEDEEDGLLSRKEKKEKVRRKGAHKEVHDKERPKGKNKKERFVKDESQSEPEEVVREKSKRKKKATHDKEESVKGFADRDHYSDTEVSGKVRKRSKKHSKKREVYTESESEASSDEDEMENSSFDDDTSQKGSARRKLTKHTQVKIKERYPQKEHRKDEKKKDAKFRDIQYSDEEVSTKSAKKLRKLNKVETEEESSSASSSDEEFHRSTKKSKHTETKSAARTKDTAQYESEEKGKTSGKKRVSLKPKSATAKETSHYPEEYKDKGRKKAVRVDERVGKSTDSSRETYHKTRSKPPRKEAEGKREAVSEKKVTAPSLEQDLPSSEMAQTDSGDGESDESSEDESVQYPKRLKFEETQSFSHDSDKHVYGKGSVGWKGKSPRAAGVKRSLKSIARRPYGTQRRGNESKDVRSVQSQAPFSGYESKQKIPSPKQMSKAECASEHLLSSEEEMSSSSLVLSRPRKTGSVLGGIEMSTERSDSEPSSREQEEPDTLEERRRRKRIRKTIDTPLASDPSSYPTSKNETRRKYDNSEWQRRRSKHARYHRRGRERYRERERQEGSSSSSDSADSSPECDRNLSESERRKLKKLFKCAFGRLCRDITNPDDVAVELQAKRLLSRSTTESILSSPDSRQAKAIFLVRALARRIKPRPDRVFTTIEVFCSSEGLQDIGREMKIKAGKSPFIL